MAVEAIGKAIVCDLERSEGDTDGLPWRFTSGGTPVDTTGWSGTISVGLTDDDLLTGGATNQYTGSGSGSDGLVTIDFSAFDIPIGNYKYDIRINTGSGERVYARGKFVVKKRIN